MRFGKKGKLSPCNVGLFQIVERGPMAYRLTLPLEFAGLHDVFHVIMPKMYHPNPSHIIPHQKM